MKKEVKLVSLVVLLIFVSTIFLVSVSAQISIYRAPLVKDVQNQITTVKLGIASSSNVLAIEETFSSPDCFVIDYVTTPGIDIAQANQLLGIWVLANKSENLANLELDYSIPYNCTVKEGSYYVLDNASATTNASLKSEKTIQTKTLDEFNSSLQSASKKVIEGIYTLYWIIGISILVALIILYIIISYLKRPTTK